jgi:hypothetical protein
MTAAIEVLEMRSVESGNLKAFAKIKLGCVVIYGCRIIQQPGQRPWVALPQTPARKKADGSGAGWDPVIEITNRDVMDQIRGTMLEAWDSHEAQPARATLPFRGQGTWDVSRHTDRSRAAAAGEALLRHAPDRGR